MGNQNQKPGTPGKPEPVPYTTFSLAKKPAENPNEPQKEDENDRIVEVISSESLKDDSQDKNSLDPRVFQNYQTFFEKFCKFADLQPLISNPALFETDFSVNKDKTALEFFWGEAQKRKTSLDVLDGITPRLFFDIFAEYQTEFMKIHHGLHSEELTLLRKLGEAKLTSNTLNQKIAEKADKLKKVAICLEDVDFVKNYVEKMKKETQSLTKQIELLNSALPAHVRQQIASPFIKKDKKK